jgi:RND family efflux transporter MFP subunit
MNRIFFAASVTGTLLLTSCGGEEPGALPRSSDPISVRVSPLAEAAASLRFPALVEADQQAELATRMSGTIRTVRVDVGDRVRAGDVLASLDETDLQARLAQIRAAEALAETSHQRLANLVEERAASQHELDQATAALDAVRAQREEVEAQRSYATLRAPFNGVITQRLADPGDLAVPGRPILTLTGSGTVRFVADLPAQRAGRVRPGDPVTVVVDGVADPVPAEVRRVVEAVGPRARTFRVEATATGSLQDILPGTYARLQFNEGPAATRWIPSDAIVQRGQLTGVYTVEDGFLRLRWIRIGVERDGAVEFLSGPLGLEQVVRRPAPEFRDGLPVSDVQIEAWLTEREEDVTP